MLQPDKKKRTHSGSRSVLFYSSRNLKNTEVISTLSMLEASTRILKMLKLKQKTVAVSIGHVLLVKIQQNKKNIRTHSSTQKIE